MSTRLDVSNNLYFRGNSLKPDCNSSHRTICHNRTSVYIFQLLASRQEHLGESLAAVREMQAKKMSEREELLQELEAMRIHQSPEVGRKSPIPVKNDLEGISDKSCSGKLRGNASQMRIAGDTPEPITVKSIGSDEKVAVSYRGAPLANHRRKTHLW